MTGRQCENDRDVWLDSYISANEQYAPTMRNDLTKAAEAILGPRFHVDSLEAGASWVLVQSS